MGLAIEVEKTSEADARQAGGNRAAALAPSGVLAVVRAITVAALTARTTIYLVCHERESMPPLVWVSALALEFAVLSALLVKVAMSFYQAHRPARSVGSEHRLGPYTLGEKIGEGGMGVVYKAHHAMLKRPTAIKLLPSERAAGRELERFEREVQLTSMLSHPNTISVYDFGRTDEGSFYYAMEYLEGLDLQALVEKSGPQPPARVAHLLAQVCGALVEAHGVGLLHRDIKPANVFLCERGGIRDVVKVLDFGLIKQFGSRNEDAPRTESNAIVGTPMYLSPEAVTAPEEMDGRSDLYAVGALGYFLLTGAPPFSGKSMIDVCCQHLHAEPVPPSRRAVGPIPASLEELILSCLAKSPARRPADAASLQRALLPLAAAWTQEAAARGSDQRHADPEAPCQLDPNTASRSDIRSIVDQAA
jgi:eukaryotic-like serine/threonine-protein kinase